MTEAAVTLLTFRAGELRLAIAAGAARAVGWPSRDGAPHIAGLLGVDPGDAASAREVVLVSRGREVRLRIDGPVSTRALTRTEIVPPAPGVPRRHLIAGFAHDAAGLTLLLDVERVIDSLAEAVAPRSP